LTPKEANGGLLELWKTVMVKLPAMVRDWRAVLDAAHLAGNGDLRWDTPVSRWEKAYGLPS